MNNIISIKAEEFLDNSDARIFMIIYTCEQGTFFCLPGGTIQNVEHGTMEPPAIERRRLVEEYGRALTNIRSSQHFSDGRLDIVALPSFRGQ